MKKIIITALTLFFVLAVSVLAFAADTSAKPTGEENPIPSEDAVPEVIAADEENQFPSVEAICTVFPKGGLKAAEEQRTPDPYTIPGGAIGATEEDIRKSEEAKQRIPAEKESSRVVYISAEPVTPVIGERSGSVRAEVSDPYTIPGGAIEATEEDIRKSEEAKQRIPAEKQPARNVIISDVPLPPAIGEKQAEISLAERLYEEGIMPRNFWYSLEVVNYGQEEKMSCGPACARTVLEYLTGNSYTEETIRNNTCYDPKRGTRLGDLVEYMNAELDKEDYYGTHFKESKDTMQNCIYSAIAIFGDPVIISVVPGETPGSPYSGKGRHFVTIYGCTSDKDRVAVSDSWAGYIDDVIEHYFYLLSIDDLYSGYEAADAGFAS